MPGSRPATRAGRMRRPGRCNPHRLKTSHERSAISCRWATTSSAADRSLEQLGVVGSALDGERPLADLGEHVGGVENVRDPVAESRAVREPPAPSRRLRSPLRARCALAMFPLQLAERQVGPEPASWALLRGDPVATVAPGARSSSSSARPSRRGGRPVRERTRARVRRRWPMAGPSPSGRRRRPSPRARPAGPLSRRRPGRRSRTAAWRTRRPRGSARRRARTLCSRPAWSPDAACALQRRRPGALARAARIADGEPREPPPQRRDAMSTSAPSVAARGRTGRELPRRAARRVEFPRLL